MVAPVLVVLRMPASLWVFVRGPPVVSETAFDWCLLIFPSLFLSSWRDQKHLKVIDNEGARDASYTLMRAAKIVDIMCTAAAFCIGSIGSSRRREALKWWLLASWPRPALRTPQGRWGWVFECSFIRPAAAVASSHFLMSLLMRNESRERVDGVLVQRELVRPY